MGRAGVEHPTFTLKRHPVLDVLNTLLIRKVYICFYFTLWKKKHLIKTLFIETITLITPLFGRVHFKTNYNYRLSNHCLINELILVTYALISNAVENSYETKVTTMKEMMQHYWLTLYLRVALTLLHAEPWWHHSESPRKCRSQKETSQYIYVQDRRIFSASHNLRISACLFHIKSLYVCTI